MYTRTNIDFIDKYSRKPIPRASLEKIRLTRIRRMLRDVVKRWRKKKKEPMRRIMVQYDALGPPIEITVEFKKQFGIGWVVHKETMKLLTPEFIFRTIENHLQSLVAALKEPPVSDRPPAN